jgi:hypothetical protein
MAAFGLRLGHFLICSVHIVIAVVIILVVAAVESNRMRRQDRVNVGLFPIRQVTHCPQGVGKGVFIVLATRQQAREHR